MKKYKFQVGDKIKIVGNDLYTGYVGCNSDPLNSQWMIGGIINHPSPTFFKIMFNEIFATSCFWESELRGVIEEIGKNNHYIIHADDNNLYCYHDNYDEMELLKLVKK